MSGSPPPPSQRQPRHEGSGSQWASQQQNDKLQIRVVPYSPPRISSDGSVPASSRAVSYTDISPLDSPSGPPIESVQRHDQKSWIKPSVSGLIRPFSSLARASPDPDTLSASSRASSPRPTSSRRPKRAISVNSDKTFSLIPQSDSASSWRAESVGSPQLSSTTPSSSWGRVSSNIFLIEERSSSPLTPQAERRFSSSSTPSPVLPPPGSKPIAVSRNYRLRGGVREVGKSPDPKGKQPKSEPPSSDDDQSPPPETTCTEDSTAAPQLSTRSSSQTSQSGSTLSNRTNYKIYAESSPIAPAYRESTADIEYSLRPSSSHSNYQILGETSPSNQSLSDQQRPPTSDSDANYVVHGAPSASCSSLASNRSPLRSEYSRESLVVAPLRPVKKRSFEYSGVFKSRSRESLRRGSLTSLGSALTQEAARALLVGSSSGYPQGPSRWQGSWDAQSTRSWNAPSAMPPHPHQWSAALSTVVSESDGEGAPLSRSLSPFSTTDRRSSAAHSTHTRNLLSISSSVAGLDEKLAGTPFRNKSPERPPAPITRNVSRDGSGGPSRLIRDYDEDGDGLADLNDQLHDLPSRARLASFVSNSSSDRALRSSGSTRSLNPFSLPAWARLYYGTGERRFLIAQASSDSMRSLYNGSLYNEPPYNNILSRSPSAERFTSTIRNPRRRPREAAPASSEPELQAANSSAEIPEVHRTEVPDRVRTIARGVKKQTSSIWSPHLRRDRRASRYSIWDPPSAVWSTESGFDWRRNQQVVLFVVGFIIPFAWMIASFLPLPPKPQLDMMEQHHGTSHVRLGHQQPQPMLTIDEIRYNSARWWRSLNRGMSIIGVLVLSAIIALIIVGVKQQWGS